MNQYVVPGVARSLDMSLQRHQHGSGDPTHRRVGDTWFRASHTPTGPVLLRLTPRGDDVLVDGWGPGLEWALGQVETLLGYRDDWSDFLALPAVAAHPVLFEAARRVQHWRIGGTELVAETLVPTVIEQKVTGAEAFRSIRYLTLRHGSPAPGPVDDPRHPAHRMVTPPSPETWVTVPSWEFRRAGVEGRRADAAMTALRRLDALQRLATLDADPSEVGRRLRAGLESLPGIGPWTSARVAQLVVGDPDAWSIGDYHIPGHLSRVLTGQVGDDAATEQALEPFRPHRYRVECALMSQVPLAPRRGPRRSLPDHVGW